ncbi:Transposase protein [Popillia japonica]|uniref:Transposase protein n=1 Tax=Popillia japonica TaxID=7064 RepID=A0AAW1MFZ7_POPJA
MTMKLRVTAPETSYKCGLSLIMGKAGCAVLGYFGPNKKLKKIVFPKCYLPAPIKFKETEAELSERDNSVWLEHSYYVKESNSAEDTLQITCCELPDDRPGPSDDRPGPSGEQYKAHLSPVGDIVHTTSTPSVLLEVTSTQKRSPKTKYLYSKISLYKRKYAIQRRKTETYQQRLANAKKYSDSIVFAKLTNALNVTSRQFFKSQIECSKKKLHGRRFTTDDKITALALFKQTGSGYKFLSEMFALPSRVTIMKLLNDTPIGPGLNSSIIEGLTEMAKTLKALDKYCILTFDEMSIMPHLTYNKHKDEIEGFECCANDVRTTKIADHAQVFMLRGHHNKTNKRTDHSNTFSRFYYCGHTELKLVGFKTLIPRSINQDPLENFFGRIRQRGVRYTNPTCSAFNGFYKSLLVKNLLAKQSVGANCEEDGCDILLTLKKFISANTNKQKQAAPRPTEYTTFQLPEDMNTLKPLQESALAYVATEYTTFQLPEDMNTLKPLQESALAYVAGYIIKHYLKLSNCNICISNVLNKDAPFSFHDFIMEKEIGGALLFRLKYCKKELFQNFVKMYNIIMYILKNHIHSPNLLKSINQTLSVNIKFGFSHCVHYRKLEVILPEKFATLMIFNYVKGVNSIIAGRDTRPLPDNASMLIIAGRDTRPLPDNASMLYKEAKHIYSKRK